MAQSKHKKKETKTEGGNTHKGRLEVTRSGMGFVIVEGMERDIAIRKEYMGTALDGDEVRVEVAESSRKGSRQDGKIVEVITRRRSEFSGKLDVHPNFAFLIPDKDNMPIDIFVPIQQLNGGKTGDRAIVRITEWSAKAKNPVGEVVSILTGESTNEIAMQGLLIDNGFPLHFPDDVVEEAARFSDTIDAAEVKKRRDMRGTLTITIDPVDAKDFDDAISIKQLKGSTYEIGVHIADVSHFVQKDTALDKEAYRRATSVYLPDRVLPMLPEHLSNGLCSLRPNEDKYAFSAIFEMTDKGVVKKHWIGRTLIRSDRRFSYEDVQEILEGASGDHEQELHLLDKMAKSLRAERFKKGAINFSSQEVRFKLDENAKPIGIVVKESKDAHKLIEEMMLLANRTVAEYVSSIKVKNQPVPFPYRVHDVPDEEKLKLFTTFASRFGHKFDLNSPEKVAASFNEMLAMVQGKPEQHVLESLGIRTMAKAVYTTENIGHYGLGFEDYCHFTSPIRRYPDVLVHRIVQECLDNDIHPIKTLEQQCRHCSDQERRAMEAERSSNKYKQVEYMQDYVGEEFDAIVSGVASFGVWAETVEHKCEGMISIGELNLIDDFELLEQEYALVGRNTRLRFRMGDRVKVKVLSANLDRRQIDYGLLEIGDKAVAADPARAHMSSGPEAFRRRSPQSGGGGGSKSKKGGGKDKPGPPKSSKRKK